MSIEPLQGRKYSGDLYGRALDANGEPLGSFFKLGNVSGLKTTREVETDSLTSTGAYDYGEAISVEIKPGATEIEITFNSFNKDGLARALMGEVLDMSTTKYSVVKEAHSAILDEGYYKFDSSDIDPKTFKVYDSADTEISPEDYELKASLGLFRFKDGAANKGQAFKVSYSTLGRSGYEIEANSLQRIELELLLDGKDRISGRQGELWIPHAVLSSNGDIDWFADDWWENGLTGTLIKHQGKPSMRFKEYDLS